MPNKRLPAVADKAVWEKVANGRAGRMWDIVVEKVWKGLGGIQQEILSIEKYGGNKTGVTEGIEVKGKASAKKEGK